MHLFLDEDESNVQNMHKCLKMKHTTDNYFESQDNYAIRKKQTKKERI